MPYLRRRTGRLAVVWLLCQTAVTLVVPGILWAAADETVVCTCAHGDHAMCPMHLRAPLGKGRCGMRSQPDVEDGLLAALLLVTAPRPAAASLVSIGYVAIVHFTPAGTTTHDITPPDPPPPQL